MWKNFGQMTEIVMSKGQECVGASHVHVLSYVKYGRLSVYGKVATTKFVKLNENAKP